MARDRKMARKSLGLGYQKTVKERKPAVAWAAASTSGKPRNKHSLSVLAWGAVPPPQVPGCLEPQDRAAMPLPPGRSPA